MKTDLTITNTVLRFHGHELPIEVEGDVISDYMVINILKDEGLIDNNRDNYELDTAGRVVVNRRTPSGKISKQTEVVGKLTIDGFDYLLHSVGVRNESRSGYISYSFVRSY